MASRKEEEDQGSRRAQSQQREANEVNV